MEKYFTDKKRSISSNFSDINIGRPNSGLVVANVGKRWQDKNNPITNSYIRKTLRKNSLMRNSTIKYSLLETVPEQTIS